jgi:uncharacterized repeat protein (TIGR01451 family)
VSRQGQLRVLEGSLVRYAIRVRNNGPAAARNVTVRDDLPPGLTLLGANVVFATPPDEPCALPCAVPELAPGEDLVVQITVRVGPAGVYSNTAEVTADNDSTPGNNTAEPVVLTAFPRDKDLRDLAELGFALVSSGTDTTILDRNASVTAGLVGSNGGVKLGQNTRVDDVLAGGNVTIGHNARVGDVTAGGRVSVGRNVLTGTLTEGAAVSSVELPAAAAVPDPPRAIGRTTQQANAGPLHLVPGSYGQLTTANNDRIVLIGGEYHFSSVTLGNNVRITVDLRNGEPLTIRVVDAITIGNNLTMTVTGGTAASIGVLAGGNVTIGANAAVFGTWVASAGQFELGHNARLTGAVAAEHLHARQNAAITHLPYGGDHAEPTNPA